MSSVETWISTAAVVERRAAKQTITDIVNRVTTQGEAGLEARLRV